MDYLAEPIVIPEFVIPEAVAIPVVPTMELPKEVVPSYKPLYVPPMDLRPPPGVKGLTQPEDGAGEPSEPASAPPAPKPPVAKPQIPEMRIFEVPGTDLEVPLPSTEILVTAGTTATVSVAATLTATALFKRLVSLMKPIIKQAWNKITKKKKTNTNDPS